jgi:hypothetical protein
VAWEYSKSVFVNLKSSDEDVHEFSIRYYLARALEDPKWYAYWLLVESIILYFPVILLLIFIESKMGAQPTFEGATTLAIFSIFIIVTFQTVYINNFRGSPKYLLHLLAYPYRGDVKKRIKKYDIFRLSIPTQFLSYYHSALKRIINWSTNDNFSQLLSIRMAELKLNKENPDFDQMCKTIELSLSLKSSNKPLGESWNPFIEYAESCKAKLKDSILTPYDMVALFADKYCEIKDGDVIDAAFKSENPTKDVSIGLRAQKVKIGITIYSITTAIFSPWIVPMVAKLFGVSLG